MNLEYLIFQLSVFYALPLRLEMTEVYSFKHSAQTAPFKAPVRTAL